MQSWAIYDQRLMKIVLKSLLQVSLNHSEISNHFLTELEIELPKGRYGTTGPRKNKLEYTGRFFSCFVFSRAFFPACT